MKKLISILVAAALLVQGAVMLSACGADGQEEEKAPLQWKPPRQKHRLSHYAVHNSTTNYSRAHHGRTNHRCTGHFRSRHSKTD